MDFAVGWFADPIYLGRYPQSMMDRLGDRLPTFSKDEVEIVKGSSEVCTASRMPSDMTYTSSTAAMQVYTSAAYALLVDSRPTPRTRSKQEVVTISAVVLN